jgi:hypothetical protein
MFVIECYPGGALSGGLVYCSCFCEREQTRGQTTVVRSSRAFVMSGSFDPP